MDQILEAREEKIKEKERIKQEELAEREKQREEQKAYERIQKLIADQLKQKLQSIMEENEEIADTRAKDIREQEKIEHAI